MLHFDSWQTSHEAQRVFVQCPDRMMLVVAHSPKNSKAYSSLGVPTSPQQNRPCSKSVATQHHDSILIVHMLNPGLRQPNSIICIVWPWAMGYQCYSTKIMLVARVSRQEYLLHWSGDMNKQARHAKQALTAVVIDGCIFEHNAIIMACKV